MFETQLRETEAATETHKKRGENSRRIVAKEDILYSQEGRLIIRNRAIEEAIEVTRKKENAAKRAQARAQNEAAAV